MNDDTIRNFLIKHNRTFYELISTKHLDDINIQFDEITYEAFISYDFNTNKFISYNNIYFIDVHIQDSLNKLNNLWLIELRKNKLININAEDCNN